MRKVHLAVAGWLLAGLTAVAPADGPAGKGQMKVSAEELDRLILQLGDDDLAKRGLARKQLEAIGEPAAAGLRKAAEVSDDPVVREAAKTVLEALDAMARGELPFGHDLEPADQLGPMRFSPLDLQGLANQSRTADFHQDNLRGNDLGGLAAGEHRLLGIPFRVGGGVLQLGSRLLADKPAQVRGIKVGRTFTHLHVLHATAYSGEEPDGVTIGRYTVRYEDGVTRAVPIVNGRDVRGWWKRPGAQEPSRGKVAWEGTNDCVKRMGAGLWLFVSSWENPRPGAVVVGLEYASAMTQSAPFCVAITTAAPLRARAAAGPVSAADFERLWEQLGGDGYPAADAVEALAGVPAQAVPFLAARLRAARPAAVERRVGTSVARLDDREFAVRERATRELEALGPEASPYLRRSLGEPISPEVRSRIERVLARLNGAKSTAEQRRWQGALFAFELIGTAEARKALEDVSRESAGAWLVSSARASLQRLANKKD
jgi:hypothetical protein